MFKKLFKKGSDSDNPAKRIVKTPHQNSERNYRNIGGDLREIKTYMSIELDTAKTGTYEKAYEEVQNILGKYGSITKTAVSNIIDKYLEEDTAIKEVEIEKLEKDESMSPTIRGIRIDSLREVLYKRKKRTRYK